MCAALVELAVLVILPFRWIDPPTSAFMLRERLRSGAPVQHEWKDAAEISPHLAVAVLAAEDQRFPTHHGLDWKEIGAALEESGAPRGASTITQQVAKNLFLWPARSLVRKLLEVPLALLLEELWGKRRILEVYLNVAEFGPGLYGAEAASRAAFRKPASELREREAALLAAVLPNPSERSIVAPSNFVRERAERIAAMARGLGGPAYLQRLEPREPAAR